MIVENRLYKNCSYTLNLYKPKNLKYSKALARVQILESLPEKYSKNTVNIDKEFESFPIFNSTGINTDKYGNVLYEIYCL